MNQNSPFKILVVDDNTQNIQVIMSILHEANYEIGFSMTGEQALEMLADSPDYDLVLLDIMMPKMDGFEVCQEMKRDSRFKDIPVIFLSASHEMDSIIKSFEAGGIDYVMKPFNAKELLKRVETHLQLKQVTFEAKNYARQLEILNATKDKFFSIIAHDLRNPFEGIRLICSNLMSRTNSEIPQELKQQLLLIAGVAENGNKLLENLLLWSKSQTGNIAFHQQKLDIGPLIIRNVDAARNQAVAKKIHLSYEIEDNLIAITDEDMFCHVIRNLLNNAIKFTEKEGIVSISAMNKIKHIEIAITDTGIGITGTELEKLFSLTGNIASRHGTENENGTGLGLILCKEFVSKMGGEIFAESEPGKGSRFRFTIPESTGP